jgi:hypothetical protein
MSVIVRSVRPGDRAEWLHMRKTLWDDCPDDQQVRGMGEILESDSEEVFVAERPGAGLCGFDPPLGDRLRGLGHRPEWGTSSGLATRAPASRLSFVGHHMRGKGDRPTVDENVRLSRPCGALPAPTPRGTVVVTDQPPDGLDERRGPEDLHERLCGARRYRAVFEGSGGQECRTAGAGRSRNGDGGIGPGMGAQVADSAPFNLDRHRTSTCQTSTLWVGGIHYRGRMGRDGPCSCPPT